MYMTDHQIKKYVDVRVKEIAMDEKRRNSATKERPKLAQYIVRSVD